MAFDACMIMCIIYIQYSILWVFALSMSVYDYLVHILNVSLKILAGKPTKKVISQLFLNVLKI